MERIRDFIRICKIRAGQDQYTDPDAYRKAFLAVQLFVDGDEDRAVEVIQGSGKNVDTSVWRRA